MSSLSNKRIILGITGGIAAYKACEIIRLLTAQQADVRVVMTKGAQAFITPLTLQALSGNPVHTDLLDPKAEAAMGHIELAKWADIILIAPASADSIARIAGGFADDLLTTLILASDCKRAIAPAMNQSMYLEPKTQSNLRLLEQNAYAIFGPGSGAQACGDVGPGRMLEPTEIVEKLAEQFESLELSGKHIVITAGPTREALDPVRFISNHSSGKMGYALAECASLAGATVTIISGPVAIAAPERVNVIYVESAQEMLEASREASIKADVFIAAAAVADYRPVKVAEQKIKKAGDTISLELIKNPDIVASISQEFSHLFMVGFAAETENLLRHAQSKLKNKGLDMIIANDVSNVAIGFNSDDNAVTVITENNIHDIAICNKRELAAQLITLISTASR
ncbi:MAG: bifunctional phosphopantothenoylcysteine decarboxylase/phosphopantothenate--cysteine ligase CoaBC [Sinobacterium sp.]|nr:bifunctional phosphopantothenoylcysteine decarboxylase/phosphopantothenate--cysteine ligase CoaBC [Sinobacterium sp.]